MSDWQDLVAYIGFNAEDEKNLRRLGVLVEPKLQSIVDHFYAAILNSSARTVLQDEAQVERLKGTLVRWIRELLNGPYDEAYWERRKRIGWTHARVGLPHRFVFAALNLIRMDLLNCAWTQLPPADIHPTCQAIARITDIELAVMSATYMDAHEDIELRTLQDLIIRAMPVTILCLDDKGRVTAATRPSARIFGEEAEIGRHYEDFFPSDLIEASDLPSHVGRCLATGEDVSLPRIVMGKGIQTRQFRIAIVPLQHELARLLLHIEETTEVVQAEARAQQAESLARIGSLAAAIAHEIRNPLTAISTTLQVISNSLPADDRRKMILGKVGEQVTRLDRLVSDLLGYARKATPRPMRLDLMGATREAILASGVPADLYGDAQPVQADPQFISQILINLLQNAWDALEQRGQIVVRVFPGGIRVIDNGPGVPTELGEKIFEPFVTSKTRGTGLGLAISRKLAESMGGSLNWSPPPSEDRLEGGPGACFELRLPLV